MLASAARSSDIRKFPVFSELCSRDVLLNFFWVRHVSANSPRSKWTALGTAPGAASVSLGLLVYNFLRFVHDSFFGLSLIRSDSYCLRRSGSEEGLFWKFKMAQKRMLENEQPDTSSSEEKRPRPPTFAAVIAEAMKMHSLQKFCSALEPLLRRVVSEEVEQALARRVPAKLRSSAKQINGSESVNLQLQFKDRLSLPIFTGSRVEGDQGCPIHLVLVDASIGQVVTCGPESSMKVEIVVLEGDFDPDEEEDWTEQEFDNHVVRERDGKRPLLTGDLVVNLKEGVGILGELTFTDNSSWIRSRKFRLGARIPAGCCGGVRIREAKTEAFTVKDHRGELYKKHYPPALHDEVWRLDKIGKDGAFHKRLNNERIFTVQDFLRLVFMDPHRLRNVLGNGMSNKMWEGTVEHAKTCVLDNKLYIYYADAQHNIGIVFNVVYELVGLLADAQYIPVDELSETQKVFVDKLAKLAYDRWDAVIEYDGGPLISNRSHCLTASASSEEAADSLGPPSSDFPMKGFPQDLDGQGVQPDHGSQMMDGGVMNQHHQTVEPINSEWMAYSGDNSNTTTATQFAIGAGLIQQNMIPQTVLSSALALAPRQVLTTPFALPYQSENLISYTERHDFINEHIARNLLRNEYADEGVKDHYGEPTPTIMQNDWTRETHGGPPEGYYCNTKSSDELASELENKGLDGEDLRVQVQNLIHIFNTGTVGQSQNLFSNAQADESYTFSGFTSTPDVNLISRRPLHGKAYMGWLKLKAALKWGISIRNVAAARRARVEVLED